MEIQELRNAITELKNSTDSVKFNRFTRFDMRDHELKSSIENSHVKAYRVSTGKSVRDIWNTVKINKE